MLLEKLDGVRADVAALRVEFAAHCAAEVATAAASAGRSAGRSKWIDRAWTLGVCLVGCGLGLLLKR